uniref:pH-response regulator protein palC n=1 Tax=Kwoniella dejecticola CBS 10117 TaxID=1296121 RepID=A0A1A6A0U5_9TREE|nr:pH-response regulator protein palC [Kwoniella dejecticola CBS 10117]OBR83666.1 pH-response regulator protein palC [Kwoniella dejecticola CBS 10117]
MPPYLLPLSRTSLLTYSSLLTDPSGSYTGVLADATAARTKLQLALKSVADNEPGASALAVIDAVQVYLPYLKGIIACLDADELLFRGEPNFPWSSPLTSYTLSSPLLQLPSIHSEHLFVLLTYILALSNHAHSILASLPSFEPSPGQKSVPHMSAEDDKRTTAGLSRAVDLLCQASGIADWVSENVSLKIDSVKQASGGRVGGQKWPIESNRETFKGLSMMLLADAHLTAIRKLLLPVLPHVLFSPPGPPLPSNHPSPSLLAKLYLHVTSLYNSSRALLKANSSSSSSIEVDSVEGEMIVELKRYLKKENQLSMALAYKWLGIDSAEGKSQKLGEGIAFVKESLFRLEDMESSKMKSGIKNLSIKNSEKKKEERKNRVGRLEREIEDTKAWLRSYTKLNDTVAFQPIPPASSLIVPPGRPIFTAKPFVSPLSKFEPTHRLPSPNAEDEAEQGENGSAGAEGEYAGKGNYF